MKFKEIVFALLRGKKITSEYWQEWEYIYLNEDGDLVDEMEIKQWDDYKIYTEDDIKYRTFTEAMQHIANGGKAKRKNWNWALLLDKNEYVEKVKWDDEDKYKNYLTEKEDILTKDWILL
jgi:hypothetical protein